MSNQHQNRKPTGWIDPAKPGTNQDHGAYHKGPPLIGSSWSTASETRTVKNVLPGRSNGYLVLYAAARRTFDKERGAWVSTPAGQLACTGDEWSKWVHRRGAKQDAAERG